MFKSKSEGNSQTKLPPFRPRRVSITGSAVEIAVGDVTTKANATAIVTTNRQNLSTGTVTIVAKASTLVSGNRINVDDGSVLIKQWNGIVPGATMTWEEIQTSLG